MTQLRSLTVAVSTLVLAAMAVFGTASACPLGSELQVDDPSLTWPYLLRKAPNSRPLKLAAVPPKLEVRASVGDHTALVRVIERDLASARCGVGRGELVVRVVQRAAIATTSGFDRITASCLERTLATSSVRRIADDTFVRVAIELR